MNDRRRRRRLVAALGPAALVAMLGVVAGCTRNAEGGGTASPSEPVATNVDGSISFPLPDDTEAAVKLAGLTMGEEGHDVDYRAHLDVIVDGKPVTVPANIGIDAKKPASMSPLHTHDATGTIHIAASKDDTFRVGQLFQEWGVRLDKTCLAKLCADEQHQLLGFANGQLVPDPASIPIQKDQEIVIWYGPKGTNPTVPVSYAFPG